MNIIIKIDNSIKVRKYEDLINELIIINVNSFNESTAKDFRTGFDKAHRLGQFIIPVIIDSYGGEVYSLLSMIAIMENSKIPVMTIVEGKAMSCGSILSGFGSKGYRYIDNNASFMMHDISSSGYGKMDELVSRTNEIIRLNEFIYTKLALKCGQDKNYFKNLINGNADTYMSPKQVLKHKIVDKIGSPNIEIVTNVNYSVSD